MAIFNSTLLVITRGYSSFRWTSITVHSPATGPAQRPTPNAQRGALRLVLGESHASKGSTPQGAYPQCTQHRHGAIIWCSAMYIHIYIYTYNVYITYIIYITYITCITCICIYIYIFIYSYNIKYIYI